MAVVELGTLPREWHLTRWWLGAAGCRLQDTAGRFVVVLHPGYATGAAGPDFRGTVVQIDGRIERGDAELHVRASDWLAHGHQHDPAYNGVMLHVVWLDDVPGGVPCEDGRHVPAVELRDLASELLEAGTGPAEPCRELTETFEGAALAALLDELGSARFDEKVAMFQATLEAGTDPGQALYAAMLEALGYSANRRPFRQLAVVVPLCLAEEAVREGKAGACRVAVPNQEDEGEVRLRGLLMGAAGLLPSQRQGMAGLDLAASLEAAQLERHWLELHARVAAMPLTAGAWRLSGVRPANAPPRRIAAAAALLARAHPEGLTRRIRHIFTANAAAPAHIVQHVLEFLTVPAAGFWSQHADFTRGQEGDQTQQPAGIQARTALIGTARAAEIAVNAVLPWAAAAGLTEGDTGLLERARQTYQAWPGLAQNSIARTMLRLWSGRSSLPPVRSARRHQALLHVWRHWCAEKRCTRCPIGMRLLAQGLAIRVTG
jgi:hypothetical protein